VCAEAGLAYDPVSVEDLIAVLEGKRQPLRPCYPRDIVQHVMWTARYEGRPPHLDLQSIAQACRNYFVSD